MGQMWGPAVTGSKDAGLGMLGQEIGQGEKKEPSLLQPLVNTAV